MLQSLVRVIVQIVEEGWVTLYVSLAPLPWPGLEE